MMCFTPLSLNHGKKLNTGYIKFGEFKSWVQNSYSVNVLYFCGHHMYYKEINSNTLNI